jgi:polyisoprenoid-binding protein YceI
MVDPKASTVAFSVRHLGVATVRGRFTSFEGKLEVDSDGSGKADGSVRVASIDTGREGRDGHLRAASCFDAEQYPEIAFHAEADGTRPDLALAGELTVMGRTRPFVIAGELEPSGPNGLRVSARGAISRRDYELQWSALFEGGVAVVGDRVSIVLDLELTRC